MTIVTRVPDGAAVVLEGTGEVLWHRIPGPAELPIPVDRLVTELAHDAGIALSTAEAGLKAFITDLAGSGLIELVAATPLNTPQREETND